MPLSAVQTLESQLAHERIEVEHLKTLLQRAREKTDEDKESLKKATRFVVCVHCTSIVDI